MWPYQTFAIVIMEFAITVTKIGCKSLSIHSSPAAIYNLVSFFSRAQPLLLARARIFAGFHSGPDQRNCHHQRSHPARRLSSLRQLLGQILLSFTDNESQTFHFNKNHLSGPWSWAAASTLPGSCSSQVGSPLICFLIQASLSHSPRFSGHILFARPSAPLRMLKLLFWSLKS